MFKEWNNVERRASPDTSGKPVDRHVLPKIGIMFAYAAGAPSRNEFLELVLARMKRVRASTNKRVRERNFSVWHGQFVNSYDDCLVALIFPYELDIRVYRHFSDLTRLPKFVEQGNYAPEDARATPLARYEHRTLVAYLPPTAIDGRRSDGVEIRSASVQTPPRPSPRGVLAVPEYVAPRRHDFASWKEANAAALRWVWDSGAPGTYSRLRNVVEDAFGITVRERRGLPNGGFGMLQTSWMDSRETVPVKIEIRSDLSRDLKYVVLAHEFAHFVLHFPVILKAQEFEDIARVIPEAALALAQSMRRHLPRATMELHADVFASNLLITPQINLHRIAEFVTEGHADVSAEEHAWRYLTRLFPDTAARPEGWSEYHEMREAARFDLASLQQPPKTLFEQMLRAMVFRIHGGAAELSKKVGQGMRAVMVEMAALTDEMTPLNFDRARQVARDRLEDDHTAVAGPGATATYELVRPRAACGQGPFRFVALEPAPDNVKGRHGGGWIDHHHPSDGAATIADWLTRVPDDVELRLYGPS